MAAPPKILIVEDETLLADALGKALRREDMLVDVRYDGRSALDRLESQPIDVIVLDRDIPEVHGDDVCATVRELYPNTRVLMLTASATLEDRLQGFEIGADDYLTKPFELPELLARVKALLRRAAPETTSTLTCGDVILDRGTHQVHRSGASIALSPKEFAVLETLMRAQGHVISAEQLLEEAWDANADPFSNSIRVTISHLRRKLGQPWIVQTMPGAGYYVAEEPYQ
ncbi:DNA-binding response regulator [Corynebacterium sp. NML98-0116]|uniref:response regulator transcription factor n=1 Tax=Corynebacterium TaxID=1716 RepID=UPI000878A8A6|nr:MULTISPECIES: response regulator transcription factor [Corynebacterium]AOX05791.1 DNA-binding response regulator [Corynebacterium sp. NML98-0116]MDK8244528.1 response regulator transcription factor [Corynebacterium sp. UMB10321]OFT28376.1 DNA-binding response regulator [Corynebacterium sp. HMSC08D02]UUA88133.1 response regulator transcription factor [Corynebacterium pseudogenitalium]WPJ92733.1 response regulator transcription factor [Corynebacterium sp. UMB2355A]